MKKMLLLMLVTGGMLLSAGCFATPGYSSAERNAQIARNWDYEGKQAVDDFDHLFLLRPTGHLTIWNLR